MKTRDLPFSTELKLPIDMATETLAFLGRKGRGKTYGAQRLFELLHDAGVQCVALDPVGNWWSLRVGKDGKSPGLPVYVFGGPRGDVPILPDAGAFVARVIVEKGISVILDVSRFRKAERKRFMTAFAEEFFHLKKDAVSPVHLFVEEAHKFVPQLVRDGEEQMLGAMEDIIRIGRNYGIGASLISQRSASVNKDVLSQVECLVAYQTGGRQDKKAIKDWVEENDEEGIALLAEMKSLQRGEALFWSPSALKVFKKIHITEKQTLDASSTPKIGAKARKPAKLAKVDLEGIHVAMKEIVETAAENDVGALRKRIKVLEAELAKRGEAKPGKTVTKEVKVAVLDPKQVSRIEKLAARLTADTRCLDDARNKLAQAQQAVVSEIGNLTALVKTNATTLSIGQATHREFLKPPNGLRSVAKAVETRPRKSKATEGLDGPAERVLGALAWFEAIGVETPALDAIAFLAGYSGASNGAFNNTRGRLRSMNLVTYPSPGMTLLTDEGRVAAPKIDIPPTGDALRSVVMQKLEGPQRRVLQPLIDAYPGEVDADTLAEAAGYGSSNNGAFNNVRGRLRTLGLVEYPRSKVTRASDILFPESN